MKVKVSCYKNFEIEIDDRFAPLDAPLNINLEVPDALYKECLNAVQAEVNKIDPSVEVVYVEI